ncbi:GntR family transcriptional regulator [Steroidobacter agaridevorans]|nr:GntR family transcriptional regulator [Steroidobacter agaridevorans]
MANRSATDQEAEGVLGADAQSSGGVSDEVCRRILRDLEMRRLVPGQRLIETELALRFGVGRNAVREAIQWLAAKGIVDVTRNRSPAIRELSLDEVMEVLEVAEPLNALLARLAARKFDRSKHAQPFRQLIQELSAKGTLQDAELFAATRRKFYRLLLEVAANRELRRHFASINMQIVYAQYPSTRLQAIRAEDYLAICRAVAGGKSAEAESAAKRHVQHVRGEIVTEIAAAERALST